VIRRPRGTPPLPDGSLKIVAKSEKEDPPAVSQPHGTAA
jgi:hypothetical protein